MSTTWSQVVWRLIPTCGQMGVGGRFGPWVLFFDPYFKPGTLLVMSRVAILWSRAEIEFSGGA